MSAKISSFIVATLTLSVALTSTAHAQTNAIGAFVGGNENQASTISTRGFAFSITSPVQVTALSFYDANQDGLETAHQVGIWDSTGTLLTSATVAAGTSAPLLGEFRTVSIPTITLPVGTGYTVGGLFSQTTTVDTQRISWTSATIASGVVYDGGRFINNGVAILTRPTTSFSSGFPGGSFVVGGAAVVPEANTAALLGLALPMIAVCNRIGTVAVIRRRKLAK